MRIIAKKRLREFWQARKHDAAQAERDLSAWYKVAKNAAWASFGALKQTFGSADQVGNCVVFDIGNNRFRLIGRVMYRTSIVYVLRIMDHLEYDENKWPEQCGCYKPPPKKPATKRSPSERRPAPRRNGKR